MSPHTWRTVWGELPFALMSTTRHHNEIRKEHPGDSSIANWQEAEQDSCLKNQREEIETRQAGRPLQALGGFHCHRYGVFAGFVIACLQVTGSIQRKENDYEQYAAIHSDY